MVSTAAAIACAVAGGAIVFAHLALYVGLVKAGFVAGGRCPSRMPGGSAPLTVSVVIPARDEERLLPRLLDSLDRQTERDFRVVLIDDRSADSTRAIMDAYAARAPGRVRVVSLTEEPSIGNPKLAALIRGLKGVDTDIILFTDADCIAPPDWVSILRRRFLDDRLGVVLGPIETRRTRTFLSWFHAFDHVFKYAYTAACAGLGVPTGGFGNNLAVRRRALEDVGGMESVDVTATEDAALISRVRARTTWRILPLFAREVTVLTEPQENWRALTAQEVRWHTGGLFSPDAQSRLGYRFIMIYLLVSVAALPLAAILPVIGTLALVSFTTMTTIAAIAGVLTRQPAREFWLPLVPYILASMGYNSFLTVLALARTRLVWKGRRLTGIR